MKMKNTSERYTCTSSEQWSLPSSHKEIHVLSHEHKYFKQENWSDYHSKLSALSEVATLHMSSVKYMKVFYYIYTVSPNSLCFTFQTLKTTFQHCSDGDASTSHQSKATQIQQPGQDINCNHSCAASPVIPTITSWKEVETTYGIGNCFQPLKLNLPVFVSQYPNFTENGYDAKQRDMSGGFIQLFS